MTSSPKRILRNTVTDGVVFCSPTGHLETKQEKVRHEEEQLKTLEDYWFHKGLKEGKSKGFDEGFAAGEAEGSRKGYQEGQSSGLEEGKAQGLEEGLASGQAAAQEELKEQVVLAQKIAEKIQERQHDLLDLGKPEIVSFALAVCKHLLRRELREPEVLRSVIGDLLELAQPVIKESQAEVYLAPDDYAALEGSLHGLSEDLPSVRVIPDKSLPRGDCRVEAPLGLVNFDINRQLEGLEKRVLEVQEAPAAPETFQVDMNPTENQSQT